MGHRGLPPTFVWDFAPHFPGCCGCGVKLRSRCNCYGPLFLNFVDLPLFIPQEFDLKKPLKIKYVGGGEQGLDMGGLQKEFFHMIVEAVFDPGKCLFILKIAFQA